ncbi:MAG: hypothetical protein RL095_2917 [Verrucomicrobiota bacterium]|jgi:hypothetical protein
MTRLLCLLLIFSFQLLARADGCVIPKVEAMPSMPDQQAVLTWDAKTKTEHLAIETRFVAAAGEGDYCWIVPTPSRTVVSPAPAGLMAEQAQLLGATKTWLPAPWGGIIILLLPLLLLLSRMVFRQRGKSLGGFEIIVLALILMVFAAMLMPALGGAGDPTDPEKGVLVHDRKTIDGVEVVVLEARNLKDLMAWMEPRGFQVPEKCRAVLAVLLEKKWFITTCRLSRVAAGKSAAKTLCFRFPVESPIYPMRLTGAAALGPLNLRLFIAGPGTAEVEGLKLLGSASAEAERVPPALRSFVPAGSHFSALEGELSVADMQEDMAVSFGPAITGRINQYVGIGPWVCGLLLMMFGAFVYLPLWHKRHRFALAVFLGFLITSVLLVIQLHLPMWQEGGNSVRRAGWAISDFSEELRTKLKGRQSVSKEELRAILEEMRDRYQRLGRPCPNFELIRDEDGRTGIKWYSQFSRAYFDPFGIDIPDLPQSPPLVEPGGKPESRN